MPDIQDIINGEQAKSLMKDTKRLERVRDAPETQRLFQLLGKNAGGSLEQAAGRAAQGDAADLLQAIRGLMNDPEGQRLLRKMKESLEK